MRRPRIKADGAGYYHCAPRIIERRQISQFYNVREDRRGPLWEQRFKSPLDLLG